MPSSPTLAPLVPSTSPLKPEPRAATRLAIVGAGYIAEYHLEILRGLKGIELCALCDADLEKAQRLGRRFKVPVCVASLEQLVEQRIEVAHLCTPPDTHESLTRRLLELGISVFVEKPLALKTGAARTLAALARERGLRLAVNHNNVYHPAFQRLRRCLQSGALGRLEHVRITLQVPLRQLDAGDFGHWMFRAPVNILFEQAIHPLSQVHALLGPVHELQVAFMATRELAPGQIFCQRLIAAGRGARGSVELHLAFGRSFTRSSIEVLATDGSAEADLFHNLLWRETKTQALDFWNAFLAGAGRGLRQMADAARGLCGWLGQTLKLTARKDAFYVGMQNSIQAFHLAYRRGEPFSGDGELAAEVLEWCERLAANLPSVPASVQPRGLAPARPGEVIVTGANGFLGRRVVARLLESGVPVTALVRRAHALPLELQEGAASGALRLVVAGLGEEQRLREVFAGARACVHLATGGGASWDEIERAMISASTRLAKLASSAGLTRFVYVSSVAALYAVPGSATDPVPDSQPCDPKPQGRSLYARGKIATEAALAELQSNAPFGLIIMRPAVVLGAGSAMQHSGLGLWVRDNHCVGWGLGRTPLPIVLADDVAEALVRAALHGGSELDGKTLNLAARTPLNAAEIVALLARASGRRLVFHPRPLWQSQAVEIAKWVVKKLARRPDSFPSFRDLQARALRLPFASDLARNVLGWQPCESKEELLQALQRAYAPASEFED